MSIDPHAENIIRRVRIELDKAVSDTDSAILAAWSTSWDEIADQWSQTVDEITALADDGQWPPRGVILKLDRAQQALVHTAEQLKAVCDQSGAIATGSLDDLVKQAADHQWAITAAQLPTGTDQAAVSWTRVPASALDAIVKRSAQQIESLTNPLSDEMRNQMKAALIRGVAVGESPRTTAASMMKRLEGQFTGGAQRALTISRTEQLDAYRAAAHQSRQDNSDVLAGWMWMSARDPRTCPACLAMDGSVHPADEQGPDDHPNGKCTAAPLTKTWRQLGFDIDEPPSTRQSGREWFDTLPDEQQTQIMGPARLAALRSGDLDWDDIPAVRHADGWRDSVGVAPLASAH